MCGALPSRWASGPSGSRPAGHNRPSAGPPDLTTMGKGMATNLYGAPPRCWASGPSGSRPAGHNRSSTAPLTSQIPILCVHHLAGRRHCLLLAWQGRGGHNDFHRMLVSLLPLVRPRGPAGRLQSALSVCAALCSPAAPGLSQYMLMCCGPGCGPGRV